MLMKKLTSLKRPAAMLLALVMTFSAVPSSAFAQEPECSCGALCTEANPDCPVCAEAPESCGYTAPAHSHDFTGEARYAYVDEAYHTVSYSCTGCGEKSEPVTESHDGSCTLCVAPVPEEPQDEPEQQPKQVYPGCAHHDHDESCGGLLNACAYICQTCVEEIQAMVNALPAGDALIAADREELGAKLSAIVARYQKISDNAMAQIDFSRFDSAALMLNTPQAHFRFAVTKRYEAGVDGPAATLTLVDAITGEAAALVDESGISVTSLTVDGGSTSGTYWVEAGTYTLVENVQGAWKPQMFVNGVQDTDTTFTGTAGSSYSVELVNTVPPTITAVAITPATLNLHTGDYAALTAQVSATHDDMDKSVSWQSSDTAIAVVDSTGFVKAFGVGTATITATSTVDGEKHGSCTVTVHGDGSWEYTTETIYNPQDTLVANCAAEGCNHVCKLTILRPNNAIYDGTEKNCSVTGSQWYEVFPEPSYEGPADRVNVTGQDITAYLEENGVRASVTYQVEPASVAVTVPTAKSPVYNGQEQPLLEGGSVTGASGVSILYSKDKGNWSQEIPTGKNAGEYTLYWKLDGNGNYTVTSGGENGTLSAAIAQKPFIVTAIEAPDKVYDGTTAVGDLALNIDGLIPADYPSLDVQTTGSFATALPGTNITVTLNSVTLTGTASGNYRYDAENPNNVTTTTADIFKAEQTAPTGLVGKAETVSGKGDGSISGLTTAMEYALTESGTYSPVTDPAMAFGAGDWYIRYQETATHSASAPKKVTVSQGPKLKVILPQGYDITADITQADWHDTPRITLTIGAGFTATASFAVKANGTALVRENDTGYSYVIPAMEADVTITVEGLADITAPTVTIKVADNAVNSLLNAITFRHFFKATQRVTIDAQDAGSGVKQVQYYLSTGAVTDPNSITGWQDYNGSFNVDPDRKLVIYARVTDHRDNVTIAGSDGVVLDKTAPIINGVTDGGVYYTTQTVTATDNITGIADYVTLKLDGTAFAGTIPGNPAAAVTHTVTAENLAENVSAGIRITMKPISSLAPVNAEGEPITEENVVLADRAALENAKAAIETILNLQCGSATQAEKASLEDLLDEIDKLLDLLDQAKELIDRIEALPDPEDIEPDEKGHIESVEAVKKAYTDAVDGNEELERIIGEDYAELLKKLEKAIWDIRIVEGDGSRYTKNKSKALCFKANGPVKLELTDGRVISFQGILVDGKEVASTKYTVEAGSTLVTLKKSYLNGLKLGKHTIAFVYDLDGTEYETEEVTFRVKELNGSAATGDGSHIYLWAALAGASIAAAVSMILIHKRRKK